MGGRDGEEAQEDMNSRLGEETPRVSRKQREMEAEAVAEFKSSLLELKVNSKPHIKMLTMLADDYRDAAAAGIVGAVEEYLRRSSSQHKLSLLYLIDCICKDVGGVYVDLFKRNLVDSFCRVFQAGNEKLRASLYKLRQTWRRTFPVETLYAIDVKVQSTLDPAWPITAAIPVAKKLKPLISGESTRSAFPGNQGKRKIDSMSEPSKAFKRGHSVTAFGEKQVKNHPHVGNNMGTMLLKKGVQQAINTERAALRPKALPLSLGSLSSTTVSDPAVSAAPAKPRAFQSRPEQRRSSPTETFLYSCPEVQKMKWNNDVDYRMEQRGEDVVSSPRPSPPTETSRRKDLITVKDAVQPVFQSFDVLTNFNPVKALNAQREGLSLPVDSNWPRIFYLSDSLAIVLKNEPFGVSFSELIKMNPVLLDPRAITLEGEQSQVVVDCGLFGCSLEFSSRPVTFNLFNCEQELSFGVPGKEVVVNGKGYPAIFGGPPIDVWFRGSRASHSLRLNSPPPRVRISSQPRIDLWNRYVSIPLKSPDDGRREKTVVDDIFQQLLGSVSRGSQRKPSSEETEQATQSKASVFQLPPEPVLKLSSDSLKIPRKRIVTSLYEGKQCSNCCLRFDVKMKGKYEEHLDWHFRQNKKSKSKFSESSIHRNWYYSIDLWVQFNEMNQNESQQQSQNLFDQQANTRVEPDSDLPSVLAQNEKEELTRCGVCFEKFELLWLEEEEEWRYKNAMTHEDRKNYHPFCVLDLTRPLLAQHENLEAFDNKLNLSETHLIVKEEEEMDNEINVADVAELLASDVIVSSSTSCSRKETGNASSISNGLKAVSPPQSKHLEQSSGDKSNGSDHIEDPAQEALASGEVSTLTNLQEPRESSEGKRGENVVIKGCEQSTLCVLM